MSNQESQAFLGSKMSLREYKDYARSKYGSKSLNDKMLQTMDRAVGGSENKKATVQQLHTLNAKLKIGKP